MLLVIFLLNCATSLGLIDGLLHGVGHVVGIHYYVAFRVSGRTSNGLNERSLRTKESLFIRIYYGNQGYLRNIKTLPEKVDAHKNVKDIKSHIPDDLSSLQSINI